MVRSAPPRPACAAPPAGRHATRCGALTQRRTCAWGSGGGGGTKVAASQYAAVMVRGSSAAVVVYGRGFGGRTRRSVAVAVAAGGQGGVWGLPVRVAVLSKYLVAGGRALPAARVAGGARAATTGARHPTPHGAGAAARDVHQPARHHRRRAAASASPPHKNNACSAMVVGGLLGLIRGVEGSDVLRRRTAHARRPRRNCSLRAPCRGDAAAPRPASLANEPTGERGAAGRQAAQANADAGGGVYSTVCCRAQRVAAGARRAVNSSPALQRVRRHDSRVVA